MNISPISKWLYDFTADLPCRLIKRNGKPYLERYFLSNENYYRLKAYIGELSDSIAGLMDGEKYLQDRKSVV